MEENDHAEVPVDEIWQSYVSGSQMSNKMKYDVSYVYSYFKVRQQKSVHTLISHT